MIQDAATRATKDKTTQDAATKADLEALYRISLSLVVQLAAVLGKDCPVETRAERRNRHGQKAVL